MKIICIQFLSLNVMLQTGVEMRYEVIIQNHGQGFATKNIQTMHYYKGNPSKNTMHLQLGGGFVPPI